MKINLSPQRRDDTLEIVKAGDILTINGDTLDLSVIPEGATLKDAHDIHPFLIGDISRHAGEIELTFILPHGANPVQAVAFPEPLLDVVDGAIELPANPVEDPESPIDPEV